MLPVASPAAIGSSIVLTFTPRAESMLSDRLKLATAAEPPFNMIIEAGQQPARRAAGVRSATFASRVEPDVTNSSVKRGQKDCGDDHAVRCQDQPKATRLCVNPG